MTHAERWGCAPRSRPGPITEGEAKHPTSGSEGRIGAADRASRARVAARRSAGAVLSAACFACRFGAVYCPHGAQEQPLLTERQARGPEPAVAALSLSGPLGLPYLPPAQRATA